MYICEDCYYGERPPMEMCNLCTKDEDGRMSCWTPKCNKTSGGDNPSVGCADSSPCTGEPMDAAPTMPVDVIATRDALIEEQRKTIDKLMKERDDYASGCDCLNEKVNRLQEELRKAGEENDYLRKSLDWNLREKEILEAKVEMIYLIFGGTNHG